MEKEQLMGTQLAMTLMAQVRQQERIIRELLKLLGIIKIMEKKIRELSGGVRPTPPRPWRPGRSLGDRILMALAKSDEPISVSEIADLVIEDGWQTDSPNFRNVVGQYVYKFLREGRIIRVYRGRYTATEATRKQVLGKSPKTK